MKQQTTERWSCGIYNLAKYRCFIPSSDFGYLFCLLLFIYWMLLHDMLLCKGRLKVTRMHETKSNNKKKDSPLGCSLARIVKGKGLGMNMFFFSLILHSTAGYAVLHQLMYTAIQPSQQHATNSVVYFYTSAQYNKDNKELFLNIYIRSNQTSAGGVLNVASVLIRNGAESTYISQMKSGKITGASALHRA